MPTFRMCLGGKQGTRDNNLAGGDIPLPSSESLSVTEALEVYHLGLGQAQSVIHYPLFNFADAPGR